MPLAAQQDDAAPAPNHPFAFGLADGTGGGDGAKIYDIRMPIGYTLIPADDGRWGLRLRLIVYTGIYDFMADGDPDLELRFKSLAATPGVEFMLPVGGGWMLKPFAELGYGRDFDDGIDVGIWSVGMRTLATWDLSGTALSFGTEVKYHSTFTSDIGAYDDFGEIKLGFDARRPVGLAIAGNSVDLGVYVIRRHFIDAVFERQSADTLEIDASNEVGLSFGTTPRARLWFVTLPRVGLGYRWGSGVRGVRLNFGFPF